jgi:transcriptional regulator with XRE-family HTH domain
MRRKPKHTTDTEIVAQFVAARKARGWTQAELARRVGTTQSSISRFEHRQRFSYFQDLRRIADDLNTRLEVRLVPQEESNE